MSTSPIVLKFGSSVLRSRADLPTAVHEIYRWYRQGSRVVAVVSALGHTTDELLTEATDLSHEPDPHATAELLATGERQSAALLGIALDRAGIPARVVDPREIELAVSGSVLDSDPVGVTRERIEILLAEAPVIVVPGFFGYSEEQRLHLLGRGGTDLSAAFLAWVLGAGRCRLVKDVDGVYEFDPATARGRSPKRFSALSYNEAIERAAPLIQTKAVHFLKRHSAEAEVAGILSPYESVIGPRLGAWVDGEAHRPTTVLILGLGTVGFGVFQRLARLPEHFEVIGALVKDAGKHATTGVRSQLLYELGDPIGELRPDVIVDALPALELSRSLVGRFLKEGVPVISANKLLIAQAFAELTAAAKASGVSLRYSAAVGGSAPMLECIERESRLGRIVEVSGILNGTCNYILDRREVGLPMDEAIREAQTRGFAETDPSADLSGQDAARKLQILARHAFGENLAELTVEPLNCSTLLAGRERCGPGEVLRLVAIARWEGDRVIGDVRLRALAASHPFARTRGEWNTLLVVHANGRAAVVCGRGAGRWPTTEAVLADLLDVRFEQYSAKMRLSRSAASVA